MFYFSITPELFDNNLKLQKSFFGNKIRVNLEKYEKYFFTEELELLQSCFKMPKNMIFHFKIA